MKIIRASYTDTFYDRKHTSDPESNWPSPENADDEIDYAEVYIDDTVTFDESSEPHFASEDAQNWPSWAKEDKIHLENHEDITVDPQEVIDYVTELLHDAIRNLGVTEIAGTAWRIFSVDLEIPFTVSNIETNYYPDWDENGRYTSSTNYENATTQLIKKNKDSDIKLMMDQLQEI